MRASAAVLVLFVVASGCFGGSDGDDDAVDTVTPPAPPISTITPLAAQVLVSTPEHRIAEFMVARDPNDADHLVTAFGDYDSPGGLLNCAFAVSFDGGATWRVSDPVLGLSGPYLEFDGWVDFDEFGGVHAICIIQGGPGTIEPSAWPMYFHSADGGVTWSEAQHIPTDPPGRSTDKSVLGVGRDGTVYGAVSGLVGTTKDNGTTWKTMTQVEDDFAVLNGMAEDNSGTMFLLGLGAGDDIWLQRTADAGETWAHAALGPFNIPPGYNDQDRWLDQRPWTSLPNLAHDPVTDDLYVTYQTWEDGAGGYRIHVWRSTDHGVTFAETAVPAFASPDCAAPCHVTHPAIAFDLQGRVGLLVQLTNDGGHFKEVQFSASSDHGATWLAPVSLSKTDGLLGQGWSNPNAFRPSPENAVAIAMGLAVDPTTAHNVAVGIALTTAVQELQMRWNGEYWGLAASSKGFVAMWIDHANDGRPQLWSRLLAVG